MSPSITFKQVFCILYIGMTCGQQHQITHGKAKVRMMQSIEVLVDSRKDLLESVYSILRVFLYSEGWEIFQF